MPNRQVIGYVPRPQRIYLAWTLRLVRDHKSSKPRATVSSLNPAARQKVELGNVTASLRYAQDNMGLTA